MVFFLVLRYSYIHIVDILVAFHSHYSSANHFPWTSRSSPIRIKSFQVYKSIFLTIYLFIYLFNLTGRLRFGLQEICFFRDELLTRLAKHSIHPTTTDDLSAFVHYSFIHSFIHLSIDGQNNHSPGFSYTLHAIRSSSLPCSRTFSPSCSSPWSCNQLILHINSSSFSLNVENKSFWNIVVVR